MGSVPNKVGDDDDIHPTALLGAQRGYDQLQDNSNYFHTTSTQNFREVLGDSCKFLG